MSVFFLMSSMVLGMVCDGVPRCKMCSDPLSMPCSQCLSTIPCVNLTGGVQMPVVGLGTGASAFGRQCDEPPPNPPFTNERCFIEQAKLAAKAWVGRGGELVETAQDDLNQVPVGAAIAEAAAEFGVKRGDLFLMTKCIGSLTFEGTLECVYDALQMLQTLYIDLVILHSPMRPGPCFEGQVGVRNSASCGDLVVRTDPGDAGRLESWRALEITVKRGLVRAIGLSDYSVEQLKPIVASAEVPPALLQSVRNIGYRDDQLKAYCETHGIVLQSWGPLASPILGQRKAGGAGFLPPIPFEGETMSRVAASHGVSVFQIALKWVVQDGAALVVGTGNVNHMRSNSELFDWKLTAAEMAELDGLGINAPLSSLRGAATRLPPPVASEVVARSASALGPAQSGIAATGVAFLPGLLVALAGVAAVGHSVKLRVLL